MILAVILINDFNFVAKWILVCPWCPKCTLSYPLLITARKRSLGQGNLFTPVCHSVHRGRGSAQTPWMQTPPGCRAPELSRSPKLGRPPRCRPTRSWAEPPDADPLLRSTSGRYASYWNAYLLYLSLCRKNNETHNFIKFIWTFWRRSENSGPPFVTVACENFYFQSQINNQYIYIYLRSIFQVLWWMALIFTVLL